MRDAVEVAKDLGEKIINFENNKETDSEIITFKLEGKYAIYFRGLLNGMTSEEKKEAIGKIIRSGLNLQVDMLLNCAIAKTLMNKIDV